MSCFRSGEESLKIPRSVADSMAITSYQNQDLILDYGTTASERHFNSEHCMSIVVDGEINRVYHLL